MVFFAIVIRSKSQQHTGKKENIALGALYVHEFIVRKRLFLLGMIENWPIVARVTQSEANRTALIATSINHN